MIKFEYEMGQEVFSVAIESPMGIVIGRRIQTEPYEFKEYLVIFHFNESLWCQENELSIVKRIV